jgi:hypothetical protein
VPTHPPMAVVAASAAAASGRPDSKQIARTGLRGGKQPCPIIDVNLKSTIRKGSKGSDD